MKKAVCLLITLICLCSCALHDDYTGEPFVSLEYTVDENTVKYEDWGELFGYGTNRFSPSSTGGLYLQSNPNGGEAHFVIETELITLNLETSAAYFTDSKRYSLTPQESSYGYVPATNGWCFLTTKSSEPYCTFEAHFEFDCSDGQNVYHITDGCIRVGRRFQKDIQGLIKKPSQP